MIVVLLYIFPLFWYRPSKFSQVYKVKLAIKTQYPILAGKVSVIQPCIIYIYVFVILEVFSINCRCKNNKFSSSGRKWLLLMELDMSTDLNLKKKTHPRTYISCNSLDKYLKSKSKSLVKKRKNRRYLLMVLYILWSFILMPLSRYSSPNMIALIQMEPHTHANTQQVLHISIMTKAIAKSTAKQRHFPNTSMRNMTVLSCKQNLLFNFSSHFQVFSLLLYFSVDKIIHYASLLIF